MLSLNSRFGVVGEFRLNSDAVKVCAVGAGLHPQGGAEAGADMAFCEGNLQGTQPKVRASSVSPRYESSHGKALLTGGLVRSRT